MNLFSFLCSKRKPQKSQHVLLVESLIQAISDNTHLQRAAEFFEPNCDFFYEDAPMNMSDAGEEMMNLHKSFPESSVTYESIEETKSGRVVLEGFVWRGKHTGEPYSYAGYPAMPAKGTFVRRSPERYVYSFSDGGKILKVQHYQSSHNDGKAVGLAHVYEQVGGVLFD